MSMVTENGFLDYDGITHKLISGALIPFLDDELRNISKSSLNNNFYSIKNVIETNCFINSLEGACASLTLNLEDFNSKEIIKSSFVTKNINNLQNAFVLLIPEDKKEIYRLGDTKFFWLKANEEIKSGKIEKSKRIDKVDFTDEEIIEYFKILEFDKNRYEKELKYVVIYSLIKNIKNSDKLKALIVDDLIKNINQTSR